MFVHLLKEFNKIRKKISSSSNIKQIYVVHLLMAHFWRNSLVYLLDKNPFYLQSRYRKCIWKTVHACLVLHPLLLFQEPAAG